MHFDPGPADRINSFALVSYIPEPLSRFLDGLRQELVPNCFLRAHITLLPPRPACSSPEVAWNLLKTIARESHPFDITLRNVELFPVSNVIHLSIGQGAEELRELHAAMNIGGMEYQEPFPYHPHVTLAQELKPDQIDDRVRLARKRWAEFAYDRTFRVDTLMFVQASRFKTWVDLDECPLGEDPQHSPFVRPDEAMSLSW